MTDAETIQAPTTFHPTVKLDLLDVFGGLVQKFFDAYRSHA